MKTGFFSVFAVSALQLVAARPHELHEKRLVVTDITYVTSYLPEDIVYVNTNGVPIATSTIDQVYIMQTGAPGVATSAAPVSVSVAKPIATGRTSSKHHAIKGKNLNGIAYSPYYADGSCKSQADVNTDIKALSNFSMVRVYGVDCDQVTTVGSAAKSMGMKLFAGLYDLTDLTTNLQTMVSAVKGDWSHIDTVNIGNELVNSGTNTVAEVTAAVSQARTILRAAGYTGPVVTVDTFNQIIANPALCQASDYAAANCHAFFDSDMTAAGAGQYVYQQKQLVSQACGGMKTVITESGWPSSGEANGAAVPSEANMQTAISSLKSYMPGNHLILYTAYNNMWLANNADTFDAEQYWGIFGNGSS